MRKLVLDLVHLLPIACIAGAGGAAVMVVAARVAGVEPPRLPAHLLWNVLPLALCVPGLVALVVTSLLALLQIGSGPLPAQAQTAWQLVVLLSFGLLAPLHWFARGRRQLGHPVRVRRHRRLRGRPLEPARTFPFAPGPSHHLAPTTWHSVPSKTPHP